MSEDEFKRIMRRITIFGVVIVIIVLIVGAYSVVRVKQSNDYLLSLEPVKAQAGPIGTTGPQGIEGAVGAKGDDGTNGKDSQSISTVIEKQMSTVTVTQLPPVKGDKGDRGLVGPPGRPIVLGKTAAGDLVWKYVGAIDWNDLDIVEIE